MATITSRAGKWRAVVRRKGHRVQSRTFPRKGQAEAWAREVERDMDQGVYRDTRSYKGTVRDVVERYCQEVAPTHKSARWTLLRLRKLMRMPWTLKPVNEVTRDDIIGWKAQSTVSAPSLRREMTLLSAAFNYAIQEWNLPINNPLQGVSKPQDARPRARRPTMAELGALRTLFDGTKMGLLMELAIETAMRLSEMCQLTWDNVHLDERYVLLTDTKNGEERKVPLSKRAVRLLEAAIGDKLVIGLSAGTAGVYWRKACPKVSCRYAWRAASTACSGAALFNITKAR